MMQTGNLTIDAQTAFSKERRRRRARSALRWLRRRPAESVNLRHLDPADGQVALGYRSNAGLRAIPVDSIVGTVESAKARAFDSDFRPPTSSRRRWEGIWIAGRRGDPLPPISVLRVGGLHFVSDGHHRVSVARSLGMAAIDAEVIELGGGATSSRRASATRPSCAAAACTSPAA